MSKISTNKPKIAVVLFNLGGPDNLEAVQPFLYNLFNDKYIISLPQPWRAMIAWLIAKRRTKTAQGIYQQMGGSSTILPETMVQAAQLEQILNSEKVNYIFKTFICMRHWQPQAKEVIAKIEKFLPEQIILLPLYPHFSTTTTASSVEDFLKNLQDAKLDSAIKTICCYPTEPEFIKAHVELINSALQKLANDNYRILFSAHGLPKRVIEQGDPYQLQIEQTVNLINQKLHLKDYKITYQSRVGPLEWIGPNTEEEIKIAGNLGKNLIIVPIAFVSEHSETLVELDIEYGALAKEYNIQYLRVPTLSVNQNYLSGLKNMVFKLLNEADNYIGPDSSTRNCSLNFSKCPCKL